MADSLDDLLDDFYNRIKDRVDLTTEQRSQVTAAGAEAYAEELKKATPRSAMSYASGPRKAGKSGEHRKHLADTITFKPGYTAENLQTGDTDTGFQYKEDDFLVRIIDDGKKKMSAKEQKNLHFIERAQANARSKMAEAMAKKIEEVTKDES